MEVRLAVGDLGPSSEHRQNCSGQRRFVIERRNAERTGAQPIEAVSHALRHRTTKTTKTFYARIRADDAFHDIEQALARPVPIASRTHRSENGYGTRS